MVVDDVCHEILVRVDPSFIFDCIYVCKGWLEVITSPEFRQRYQKRWKNDSKLVGFIKHREEHGYKLAASIELGCIMNRNKSQKLPFDHFISKSGAGDGLILHGSLLEKTLYVSKADEMRPIMLPPLPDPELFEWPITGTAILSQHDSYRVILLTACGFSDMVTIRTFSSSTEKWEKSEVPFYCRNIVFAGPGMVSIKGLVYWWRNHRYNHSAIILVYDANNGCVRHIDSPPDDPDKCIENVHYGLSPQGNLMCALSLFSDINIWRLDDDDGWKKLHSLKYEFFNERFVSFVPGRFDSIFLLRDYVNHLYVYNFHTHKYESYPPGDALHGSRLTTLTMADLGVWPSSPFSNAAETSNIHSVQQLLTWRTG